MKSSFLFLFLLITSCVVAQSLEIDKERSSLTWTGYAEVGDFEQIGQISLKEGSAVWKDGQLTATSMTFDMKSISHPDKALEKHLLNEDFFYVKKFPSATFEFESADENNVTGTLTIRDKSNVVTIQYEKAESEDGIHVTGQATIDRTEFDIKYNSSSYFQDVGSYAIKNEFDLRFDLWFSRK